MRIFQTRQGSPIDCFIDCRPNPMQLNQLITLTFESTIQSLLVLDKKSPKTVQPSLCVMCQVSHVICQVSLVTCQMSILAF